VNTYILKQIQGYICGSIHPPYGPIILWFNRCMS